MSDLYHFNMMQPWFIGHKKCPFCQDIATHFIGNVSGEHACRECYQIYLETQLIRANIKDWAWERFRLALSSLGTMEDRLLALIHYRRFQGVDSVPGFLIENLGFESSHPLSQYVRQKAYEVCVLFTGSQKILETILAMTEYGSWQQKANLVMVAYGIDPSDPKVKQFITHIGNDPSPNVRIYVADTIRKDKTAWARKLFQKLQFDTNPLVREACGGAGKNYGRLNPQKKITPKVTPIKKKTPSYSTNEIILLRNFKFELHEKIYDRFLSHIPALLDKKKYSKSALAALKINTKDSCVRLLAAALKNRVLFHTIIEKLPKPVVWLLNILAFEYEQYDFQIAEQKLLQIMENDLSEPVPVMPLKKAMKEDPAYFMFKFSRNWSSYTDEPDCIAINTSLYPVIRKLLPILDFGSLVSYSDIKDKVEQIHGDNPAIFRQLPIILSFIAQGNLKFNKKGTKILAGSLKKMAMVCKINEFYGTDVNELSYLKTKLLGEFFSCIPPWKPEDLKDLPGFIKNMISQYFSFTALKSHRSRDIFGHISRQIRDYDSNDQEKEIREDFKELLEQLPKNKWVSIFQLARRAYYDGMDFNPFPEWHEFKKLYFTADAGYRYSFQDKQHVCRSSVFDVLTLPFVKTMMFLLGALGMVDLGYSTPENTIYRKYDKSWLTVFDGLKYVRLTAFGAYVLGGKKSFLIDLPAQRARIEVDEYKTMVSLFGDDPIKRMSLEALGREINRSSFMVTYQSFLRDCHTSGDVKRKIKFFRDNIVKKPPPIWEGFFKEVLTRMEPLAPVQAMAVFRVKPDKALLILLTTDPVLKKMVIRAENYHVVVREADVSKLKKRLVFLGFFAG
ncbi:MAG: hypothetical protein DRH26_03275 [Deltaproteobacteria bacterium]|nr:MAG: hypothetical protein DRH26_03275 [Deltaproteobacteria bacterium]